MKKAVVIFSVWVLSFLAAPVMAHHSPTMYNFDEVQSVSGVVQKVRLINPHTNFSLTTEDGDGATVTYQLDTFAVGLIFRAGWRADTMKVGDEVTATYAPYKNGKPGGFITSFKWSDGREFIFPRGGKPGEKSGPQ